MTNFLTFINKYSMFLAVIILMAIMYWRACTQDARELKYCQEDFTQSTINAKIIKIDTAERRTIVFKIQDNNFQVSWFYPTDCCNYTLIDSAKVGDSLLKLSGKREILLYNKNKKIVFIRNF